MSSIVPFVIDIHISDVTDVCIVTHAHAASFLKLALIVNVIK